MSVTTHCLAGRRGGSQRPLPWAFFRAETRQILRREDGREMPPSGLSRAALGSTLLRALIRFLAISTLIGPFAGPAGSQVTSVRLLPSAKVPQRWLSYPEDYAGRRVSELDPHN